MDDIEYGGFWIRLGASIIDSILVSFLFVPVLTFMVGGNSNVTSLSDIGFTELLTNLAAPAIAIVIFWIYKSATPGKMMCKLVIVDAKTGGKPSSGQMIGRYLGYYISLLPLFLGFFWVAFDGRKQGWHDKLAGTVVIKKKTEGVSDE